MLTGRHIHRAATLGGALPAVWLTWQFHSGGLGVVPDEALLHWTGRFGLFALVATMAIGPAHALSHWNPIFAARRPLGLWSFAYVLAHFSIWAVFDQGGYVEFIMIELATMLHLQLGLAALLLMIPLALSSTDSALKALTLPWWRRLHLLVWPIAGLAVMHAWMVARFGNPIVVALGALVLLMMLTRLAAALLQRKSR